MYKLLLNKMITYNMLFFPLRWIIEMISYHYFFINFNGCLAFHSMDIAFFNKLCLVIFWIIRRPSLLQIVLQQK